MELRNTLSFRKFLSAKCLKALIRKALPKCLWMRVGFGFRPTESINELSAFRGRGVHASMYLLPAYGLRNASLAIIEMSV